MPAQPKPPGQRRRRNVGQSEWKQLPEQGSKNPAPKLPARKGGYLKATNDRWQKLWASPMALAYVEADQIPLERLALLWDDVARGDTGNGRLSAIQNLEDRFGISPKGRRGLQWEISKSEVVDIPTQSKKRRLRAVG